MSRHTDPQSLTGQRIAHYRVARNPGAGGIGEVFLAEDTKLDRSVALKLLPREVADGIGITRATQQAKEVP